MRSRAQQHRAKAVECARCADAKGIAAPPPVEHNKPRACGAAADGSTYIKKKGRRRSGLRVGSHRGCEMSSSRDETSAPSPRTGSPSGPDGHPRANNGSAKTAGSEKGRTPWII